MDEDIFSKKIDELALSIENIRVGVVHLVNTLESYRPYLDRLERVSESKVVKLFSRNGPQLHVAQEHPVQQPDPLPPDDPDIPHIPRAVPVLRPGI